MCYIIDMNKHSEKGLETIQRMNTLAQDWGLTEIKWEKRIVPAEVWILCPSCRGSGRIGTLKGKTVSSTEAWNNGAAKTIRPCPVCPQVQSTRKGRTWYIKDETSKVEVWHIGSDNHHATPDQTSYSTMNGLVLKIVPVEREIGIVQWTKDTKFDSRFAHSFDTCQLCAKVIPSRRFVPVTGKGVDGTIHGMWVGEDCAKKFFGIKNFKKEQIIEKK